MEHGMTQHVAYRWNGNVYCEDDIVAELTHHFPWLAWVEVGNQPAMDDAEAELNDIAHLFHIDRTAPRQVAAVGFPEYVGEHPGFCSWCKRWFNSDDH
jgi:hypothetical protein